MQSHAEACLSLGRAMILGKSVKTETQTQNSMKAEVIIMSDVRSMIFGHGKSSMHRVTCIISEGEGYYLL